MIRSEARANFLESHARPSVARRFSRTPGVLDVLFRFQRSLGSRDLHLQA